MSSSYIRINKCQYSTNYYKIGLLKSHSNFEKCLLQLYEYYELMIIHNNTSNEQSWAIFAHCRSNIGYLQNDSTMAISSLCTIRQFMIYAWIDLLLLRSRERRESVETPFVHYTLGTSSLPLLFDDLWFFQLWRKPQAN